MKIANTHILLVENLETPRRIIVGSDIIDVKIERITNEIIIPFRLLIENEERCGNILKEGSKMLRGHGVAILGLPAKRSRTMAEIRRVGYEEDEIEKMLNEVGMVIEKIEYWVPSDPRERGPAIFIVVGRKKG